MTTVARRRPDPAKDAPAPAPAPPADAGGVPLPPGYVSDPIDFQASAGRARTSEASETLAKGLIWAPLLPSISPSLVLFFAGGANFMSFNAIITLATNGFGALGTAVSRNHWLTWQTRLTIVAVGCGLLLFLLWRIDRSGLLGGPVREAPADAPFFFLVQD
jgi:hypothetical protein